MGQEKVDNLIIKRQKVGIALGNLQFARENIGTPLFPGRGNLDDAAMSEVDAVLSKLRIAEIRQKITEISIPTLESLQREIEREIGKGLGIDRLRLSIPKIEALAAGGYLSQTDLKEAQELLARLEETAKAPLVKEAGVTTPPTEADLTRKRYSEARARFEVEVFGRTLLVRGKLQAEALKAVNGTTEEKPIESDDLAGILYGENNQQTRRNASTVLVRLNKILSSQGAEVVSMVSSQERAKGAHAKYFLRKITEDLVEPKRRLAEIPVPETRLAAIRQFISNPKVTVKRIIEILGPSRSGRELTRPQALFSMQRATGVLYTRVVAGKADDIEMDVWAQIKNGIGRDNDRQALKTFEAIISAYFKDGKQVSAETEKLPQVVVDLERNIVIVDGKEQKLTGKIKKAVLLFLTSRVRKPVHNKRIERVAVGAGSKSRAPGGNAIAGLRKLLEVDPTHPKILISVGRGRNTFYVLKADIAIIEKSPAEGSAKPLLIGAKPEADAETATCGPLPVQEVAPSVMSMEEVERLEAAISALVDEEEAQVPASVVEPEKPEGAPEESKTAKKPKLLSIEKRDAHVRETISQIMDEIESKGIKKPLNADQLANHYPSLKMSFLKLVREKRYIKPEKGRDGNHPAYSIKDITMLVYVYGQHNGFSAREIRELRRLIEDEIARRKQSR